MSKTQKPTDGELDILRVLWEIGPTTVREVHTKLSASRNIGYTTVLKLMQIMTDKELLARDESQRSHVYRPRRRAESTQRQLIGDLVKRAFGGSTENLVMQALSGRQASPAEIARIRQMLDELEGDEQ